MAPDQPDATDIETTISINVANPVYGYCETYAIKEEEPISFIESSVSSETVEEEEIPLIKKAEINENIKEHLDDDLTSLSWLHQQNFLKNLEIQNPNKHIKEENILNNNICEDSLDISEENTNSISDFEDNSSESNGKFTNFSRAFSSQEFHGMVLKQAQIIHENIQLQNSNQPNNLLLNNNNIISNNNNNNVPPIPRNKHPTHIPYDPQLHKSSKPPYSFSCLIFMAIEDSPLKALPVKEVYAWILEHFPYFRNAPTGWKNSVRHNLSLNKCFRKVDKSPNLGKGSLWMVDAQYRPNLIQALSRTPFPPPTAQNLTQDKGQRKVVGNNRLPDPVLFPYLSKRLASSNICDNLDTDCDSDVDAAAAAMLSFKHGPLVVHQSKEPKKKSPSSEKLTPVITRSSTEDHTYSLVTSIRLQSKRHLSSDKDSADFDEQRKIAEGADALLNLAGVNTVAQQAVDPLSVPVKRRLTTNINLPDKRRKRWRDWNENSRYLKQVHG